MKLLKQEKAAGKAGRLAFSLLRMDLINPCGVPTSWGAVSSNLQEDFQVLSNSYARVRSALASWQCCLMTTQQNTLRLAACGLPPVVRLHRCDQIGLREAPFTVVRPKGTIVAIAAGLLVRDRNCLGGNVKRTRAGEPLQCARFRSLGPRPWSMTVCPDDELELPTYKRHSPSLRSNGGVLSTVDTRDNYSPAGRGTWITRDADVAPRL